MRRKRRNLLEPVSLKREMVDGVLQKWTEEDKAEVMARRALGWSTWKIARETGVPTKTVQGWVYKAESVLDRDERLKEAWENAGLKALGMMDDTIDELEQAPQEARFKALYALNAIAGTATDKLNQGHGVTNDNRQLVIVIPGYNPPQVEPETVEGELA